MPLFARHRSSARWFLITIMIGFAGAGLLSAMDIPGSPDLEKLRDALRTPVLQPKLKEDRDFRAKRLKLCIEKLKFADLVPALKLEEWRDLDRIEDVATIDVPYRKMLLDRFHKETRAALQTGDPVAKLAVLAQLAEMGMEVRGAGEARFAKSLATHVLVPDVTGLLENPDQSVRQFAAGALGKINPDPAAIGTLGKLLVSKTLADRRAAAASLASIVHQYLQLRTTASTNYIEMDRADEIKIVVAVIAPAGQCLRDADPQVRLSGTRAVQDAARMLTELVGNPPRQEFPPDGRPWTAEERQEIERYRKLIEDERKELLSLARSLNAQMDALIGLLSDKEIAQQTGVCEVLEEIATARLRLFRKADEMPKLDEAPRKPEDLLPAISRALSPLANLLSQKEVRVRLAAIYVLETMGPDAAPSAAALVKALADTDPFVRWGATRALGKMAPREPEISVLGLAEVLTDPNGDVRVTAAAALERYGPAAKAAVPALRDAVNKSDLETRLWILRALAAIGPEAHPATAELAKVLAPEQPAKIRLAAAAVLARIGPGATAATEALRQALDDTDGEVRQAASQALLAIVVK